MARASSFPTVRRARRTSRSWSPRSSATVPSLPSVTANAASVRMRSAFRSSRSPAHGVHPRHSRNRPAPVRHGAPTSPSVPCLEQRLCYGFEAIFDLKASRKVKRHLIILCRTLVTHMGADRYHRHERTHIRHRYRYRQRHRDIHSAPLAAPARISCPAASAAPAGCAARSTHITGAACRRVRGGSDVHRSGERDTAVRRTGRKLDRKRRYGARHPRLRMAASDLLPVLSP